MKLVHHAVATAIVLAAGFSGLTGRVDGQTFIKAASTGYVTILDQSGTALVSTSTPYPAGNWGIAVDGFGNTWSTNWAAGSNTVSKYAPNGSWIGTYPAGPSVQPLESSVGPIVIDRFNRVYVGDPRTSGNTVTCLDNAGSFVLNYVVNGLSIRSMAVDTNGDIWSLHYFGATGHIEKHTPAGTFVLSIAVPGATSNGIYADERGRILATHYPQPTNISIFDLNGNLLQVLTAASGYHFGTVAVAPDGKVWTASDVFNVNGTVMMMSLPGATFYGEVTGISFDGYGNTWTSSPFYFGGLQLTRLSKFRPDGTAAGTFDIGAGSPNAGPYNMGDMTGLLRLRVTDPYGDADNDGFMNTIESGAGTDPLNPGSLPTATTVLSPPIIGTTCSVQIGVATSTSVPYFFPWSLNASTFPLSLLAAGDPRVFPISPLAGSGVGFDPIWELSAGNTPYTSLIFPDTFGLLSATALSVVRVNIPPLPSIIGFTIHGAFCTLVPASVSGIRAISNRVSLTFQ